MNLCLSAHRSSYLKADTESIDKSIAKEEHAIGKTNFDSDYIKQNSWGKCGHALFEKSCARFLVRCACIFLILASRWQSQGDW